MNAAIPELTAGQIAELAVQEQLLLFCDGLEELTAIVRAVEAFQRSKQRIAAFRASILQPDVLPSEAVTGFAAWLTCRDEPVTIGSTKDAAPVAELTGEYWRAQGWQPPREDFAARLKRMPA